FTGVYWVFLIAALLLPAIYLWKREPAGLLLWVPAGLAILAYGGELKWLWVLGALLLFALVAACWWVGRGCCFIEVLVTVAILAVLAALLFPVFAQTREMARRASTLSSLRQIGNAMEMQRQDRGGSENAAPGPPPPLRQFFPETLF